MELVKKISDTFGSVKDNSVSFVAQKALNHYIKDIKGEMLKFRLDSNNKTIEMEVMLKGEVEPLKIEIKEYKISTENNEGFIELGEIVTSREWVNTVLALYFIDRKLSIPATYAKLVGIII
ncbi:MAG: hypothetical protein PHX13_07775 [Thiovulaceae bacterium]|nr:hypothetical protein [Sulfurimonadaceae bacterium]